MLTIESVAIGEHHPREAHGVVFELIELVDAALYATEQLALEALVGVEIVAAAGAFVALKVEASEKIVISHRHWAGSRIILQVLQIGFDQRRTLAEQLDQ